MDHEKPSKSEMQHWFASRQGKFFIEEFMRQFRVYDPTYDHPDLISSRENAQRAKILKWVLDQNGR